MGEGGLWSLAGEECLPRQAIPAAARGYLFVKSFSPRRDWRGNQESGKQPSPWTGAYMVGQRWQVGRVRKLRAPVGMPGSSQAHQVLTLRSHTHLLPHWFEGMGLPVTVSLGWAWFRIWL